MRVSRIAGLLGLAVAVAAPAAAQRGPGIEEAGPEERMAPIGLVMEPTAYTLPAGRWLIGGGTFQQAVAFRGADEQFSAGLYRGLSENLHLGAFWTGVEVTRPDGREVTESFFGAAGQWQFLGENRLGNWSPALAIGGYGYVGPGDGGTIYAVASKNLMNSVRPGAVFLHAGARWDSFDFDGFGDNDVAPFVGANLLLTRDLSLNAEWRDNHPWEPDDVMAFGASYMVDRNVVVSAGVRDAGLGEFKFYAGLSILP